MARIATLTMNPAGARHRLDHARHLLAFHPALQEQAAERIAGLVLVEAEAAGVISVS